MTSRSASLPALMLLGTASDVGKSIITAGLIRLFRRRGLRVVPFKPLNLSNNAAVAAEGGEIGRAQAVQAIAAGLPPSVHMNPVLLKPQAGGAMQVVVQGRARRTAPATAFPSLKQELLPRVMESFARVSKSADLVLVEGAGGAAETNLREQDFANMGFAEAADLPVVLIGNVERGGAIASIVGTLAVLAPADRARVKGYLVNKFHGDISLFDSGIAEITQRTGIPCLGVIPYLAEARVLPMEDAASLEARGFPPSLQMPAIAPNEGGGECLQVVAPRLPCLANFDDLDPLAADPAITLEIIEPGRALPGTADVVILPGSKATRSDLAVLREQGWDIDLLAHRRRGGRIIGLCGGYQMLGSWIYDPEGIEGPPGKTPGLGLLAVETVLERTKTTRRIEAADEITASPVTGYEIHAGATTGPDCARPMLRLAGRAEGARSTDGLVMGCYLHGLFDSALYRRALLGSAGEDSGFHSHRVEEALDRLACSLAQCLDIETLLAIAGGSGPEPIPVE